MSHMVTACSRGALLIAMVTVMEEDKAGLTWNEWLEQKWPNTLRNLDLSVRDYVQGQEDDANVPKADNG